MRARARNFHVIIALAIVQMHGFVRASKHLALANRLGCNRLDVVVAEYSESLQSFRGEASLGEHGDA